VIVSVLLLILGQPTVGRKGTTQGLEEGMRRTTSSADPKQHYKRDASSVDNEKEERGRSPWGNNPLQTQTRRGMEGTKPCVMCV
jgi:hypothetical protein